MKDTPHLRGAAHKLCSVIHRDRHGRPSTGNDGFQHGTNLLTADGTIGVQRQAVSAQENGQPAITPAYSRGSQFTKPTSHRRLRILAADVTFGRTVETKQPADVALGVAIDL